MSRTISASATAAFSTVTIFTRPSTEVYVSFVISPSASQPDSSLFPTTTSAPDDSSANVSENSLGAPIVVGVGVAALFMNVLAFYLYYRRRGNKHQAEPYGQSIPEGDSPTELMGLPPLRHGLYENPQQYQSVTAHEMLAEELPHKFGVSKS